jgi:hypothetical protein
LESLTDFISALTSEEYLTGTNFQGIEAFYPAIIEILEYTDKFRISLDNFNSNKTAYIDELITDVNITISLIRQLNSSLNNMENKPYHLIVSLRELQRYLGMIARFPPVFKENYVKPMEVSEEYDY